MIEKIIDRFVRYVQIDTESDPHAPADKYPTTEKQKQLSSLLAQELRDMGITDAEMDEYGYVYATIPANTPKKVPTLCFCAHVDTAPDCSGNNVIPIIHRDYNGADIVLPHDTTQVLNKASQPELAKKIGHTIITASGKTLLGSDDKSGVAIIMQAAQELINNKEIKHGAIKILFTPDEEVGKGTDKVDMKKLAADIGYTLDGGGVGIIEEENFSADSVHILIKGISAHPGYAKGKMQSAIKVLAKFIDKLPTDYLTPESTDGRQGFVHPTYINGSLESAEIKLIIRDFNTSKLAEYETYLKKLLDETIQKFPGVTYTFHVHEQYRNMKEIIDQYPNVTKFALEAISRVGLTPEKHLIRGGTDGARLSFMGLPCPNLFAGEQAIHSVQEWVSAQDMAKAVETVIELSKIWEEQS